MLITAVQGQRTSTHLINDCVTSLPPDEPFAAQTEVTPTVHSSDTSDTDADRVPLPEAVRTLQGSLALPADLQVCVRLAQCWAGLRGTLVTSGFLQRPLVAAPHVAHRFQAARALPSPGRAAGH